MVLVSALFFKGQWATQFDKALTRKQPFSVSATAKVECDMMTHDNIQAGVFDDSEGNASAICLAYEGNELFFVAEIDSRTNVAALPEGGSSLNRVYRALAAPTNKCVLNMPKFTAKIPSTSLIPLMKKSGVKQLFEFNDDFKKICDLEQSCVTCIKHQAYVAVDEEGTVAAAATAAVVRLRSMPEPKRQLSLDKPFYFSIVHKPTGVVFFQGSIVDPTAK